MDYLRSAYITNIYSFDPVDGRQILVPITWCKAPTGAQPLGVRHQYTSSVWSRPTAYSEKVGEVIGQLRTYSKGETPSGILGTNWCGTQWTGPLQRLTIPLGNNSSGQPSCCDHVNNPYMGCSLCPQGAANVWEIIASGFTGGLAALNGSYQAKVVSQCLWESNTTPNFIFESSGSFAVFVLDDEQGNTAHYTCPGFNCLTDNHGTLQFTTGAPGAAPQLLTVSRFS